MRHVPLFLVLASLFIVVNGITFDIEPHPVIVNEEWTVTLTKESSDPGTQFQISLLLNNQPAQGFLPFTLDFTQTKNNVFTYSSSEFGAPKFQVGSYTIVATPKGSSQGSGSQQTYSFSVVAATSPQTNAGTKPDATSASPTQTTAVTQALTQTSESDSPSPANQGATTGNDQSSSTPDGNSNSSDSSTNGPTSAADGSSLTASSSLGSVASPSGDGSSGDVVGKTTGSDGPPLPTNDLSPSLSSGDGSTSPSPNSDPSASGAASALTASKKNNAGTIAGAVVGVLALLALLVGGLLLYKRKKQKSRPFSFNRDLMVRQRAPSMMSDPSTNLPTTEDGFGYNPYSGYGDEKVRADTETLPIGTQAAAY